MECEVCGREIYGRANRAVIDGARLFVCASCVQHSTSSWRDESKATASMVKRPRGARGGIGKRKPPSILYENLELADDYGIRIRKGRQSLKLNHEEMSRKTGVKISVLQKLEMQKIVPDLDLTRRLERFLKVKLFKLPPETSEPVVKVVTEESALTLGDIVAMRQQQKKVDEKRGQ